MLNEKEISLSERILNNYKNIYNIDIFDVKSINSNCEKLSLLIYLVRCQQYYPDNIRLEDLTKLERKLCNIYYKIARKKHQHDLFNGIGDLDEKNRSEKIEKIVNDANYSNLYFADISKFSKYYFQYAAQVIIKRGYPKVEDVIPQLFVWLQDINWPGSYDIYQFLCTIPKEAILKYFEETVNEAYNNRDEGWLYYLQQLMYEQNITEKDFKNKNLFEVLNREIEY